MCKVKVETMAIRLQENEEEELEQRSLALWVVTVLSIIAIIACGSRLMKK